MPTPPTPYSLSELEAAEALVRRFMPPTPAYAWPLLAQRFGAHVVVKHENHTPIGAFKIRGGIVYCERLKRERPHVRAIVCATRGNHGQSLAFAGRAFDIPVVIVAPVGNSREKNAAMRAFGAELIEFGRDFDEAKTEAARLASERGAEFAPSFHNDLVKGVGTYALELFRAHPDLDAVYCPIGLGSGVCGLIHARDLLGLKTEIIGVVADDGTLTLQGAQGGSRAVPAGYARAHVELAYATTVYGAQGETTAVGHLVIGEHTTAASAYVGMTRGREANVAHLVAEDLDQARAQWDEVFSRDRADLGPAHAAALAADDIDRYGPQQTSRPLEEILPELWQAWTTHADLEHRHTTLAERVKGLQQAVAIHARYQPPRDRLKDAEDTTYRHWKQAEQSREDLDQALATDTTQFDQQLREAWQAALPAALAAAETLEAGPGLFGQRHRATEHAWDDLTGFAHAWRPVHPDLAFDAFQIADQIRGLTGPRLTEALAAYTAHRVAAAHPDADQIRQHEHDTNAAYHHAHRARTEYEDTMWTLFREHGGYVYTSDPQTRLVADTEVLVDLDHQLAAATTHVQALEREPAIRALPSSALDSERQRWATDRHTTQVAKARQDREDRLHRPAPTHQSPSSGYHRPVDHGYGIGR